MTVWFWLGMAVSVGGIIGCLLAALVAATRDDRRMDAEIGDEIERLERLYALAARKPVER